MKDSKVDDPYSTPIILPEQQVLKEWLDYNGHMNVAFYTLAFDKSLDIFLEDFLVVFFLGFPQLEVLYASSVVYVLLPHNQITRPQGSGPEVGLGVNSPFFFFFLAFATSFLHKFDL